MALATQTINVKAVPNAKEIARQKAKLKKQLEREARVVLSDYRVYLVASRFAHIKTDMADARGKLRRVEFEPLRLTLKRQRLFGSRSRSISERSLVIVARCPIWSAPSS
jgi:hypothetical protein